jgi:hypothetical protein
MAFGVAFGVIADRLVQGSAGTFVAIALIAIPSVAALLGNYYQTQSGERFQEKRAIEDRRHAHAEKLRDRTLVYLGSSRLSYSYYMWSETPERDYNVFVTWANQEWPMEALPLWKYARAHILADSDLGAALRDIEQRLSEGREQKTRLDRLTLNRIESELQAHLGVGFARGSTLEMGGDGGDGPFYSAEVFSNKLRNRVVPDLRASSSLSNFSDGRPPRTRYFLQFNGIQALSTWDENLLQVEKIWSAYDAVRNDPDLTRQMVEAATKAKEDADAVARFAEGARDYAESVEVSPDNLVGRCDECPPDRS